MTRLYLSGPMSGYLDHNRGAFRAWTISLRGAGHDVLDPGEVEVPGLTWEGYLRADLMGMLGCEGVATLPGWQESRGASLEVHVAHALGMTVKPVDKWLLAPEMAR